MTRGFSLIELMIVILLLGFIAVMGLPRFLRSSRTPTEDFIGRLNVLTGEGVLLAEQTHKVYKIFFDLPAKKVEVRTVGNAVAGKGISIPDLVEIQDVVINGKSQFSAGGGEKRTVYYLINPDGITQEVTLSIIDHKVRANKSTGGQYDFYLNPFTAAFRLK